MAYLNLDAKNIKDNLMMILEFLNSLKRNESDEKCQTGHDIRRKRIGTDIEPVDVNDAIEFGETEGLVTVDRSEPVSPYKFKCVKITAKGRFLLENISKNKYNGSFIV